MGRTILDGQRSTPWLTISHGYHHPRGLRTLQRDGVGISRKNLGRPSIHDVSRPSNMRLKPSPLPMSSQTHRDIEDAISSIHSTWVTRLISHRQRDFPLRPLRYANGFQNYQSPRLDHPARPRERIELRRLRGVFGSSLSGG
jgi:hypothetical protein